MRNLMSASLLALLVALLMAVFYRPQPLEAQLLHLQIERAMPEYANALSGESADLQALFLMYADEPVLLAKARLMLLRYPDMARSLLPTYGDSAEFQKVLSKYGEDIALPIHYFVTNEVFTLELMQGVSDAARAAMKALRSLRGDNEEEKTLDSADRVLTGEQRGWYAIRFLETEGYSFIGQFVMAQDGTVRWVQTERVLEGLNSFFAGGIRGLETKVHRNESVTAGDMGWAAVDVAVGVSAFKILRMGRTGVSGVGAVGSQTLTFSQRSAALGTGLWRGSLVGTRMLKYGAPAILAYIAVRHPSVIHSLLGNVAEKLGLPVALVQVVGWTLLLTPVFWLLHCLLRPLAWLVSGFASLLRWLGRPRKNQVAT